MSEWIKWNGGEMPVPGDTVVEVKLDRANPPPSAPADHFHWGRDLIRWAAPIVAYRIVQPEYNGPFPDTGTTDTNPTDAPETLRDRFAMAALTGLCANQPHVMARLHATEAYEFADAMMKARKP